MLPTCLVLGYKQLEKIITLLLTFTLIHFSNKQKLFAKNFVKKFFILYYIQLNSRSFSVYKNVTLRHFIFKNVMVRITNVLYHNVNLVPKYILYNL